MNTPALPACVWVLCTTVTCFGTVHAQSAPDVNAGTPAVPAPSSAASAPTAVPTPAAAPASAPRSDPASAAVQRIEISAGRGSDEDQRRRATAAKIVVGRDEIERMGDSNTLEILKRLPGITVPGPAGRGGAPRLRGMAGGYTQILIDGERMPPGFSLDSIPPEQIERIEILRAPTAETGARAIAGTLNLVLREGFRRKLNDVQISGQWENDQTSPSLAWTRNDTANDWIINSSVSLSERVQESFSTSQRTDVDLASGAEVLSRPGTFWSLDRRRSLHASARAQWRGEAGSALMLMPLLITSEGPRRGVGHVTQTFGSDPPGFARSDTTTDGRFSLARVNATYSHRWGYARLEWRGGVGDAHWRSQQFRQEFDESDALLRTIEESTDNRDRNASLSLKASSLVGDGHSLVGGLELESQRRRETKLQTWDGVPQLQSFEPELGASSRRWAAYVQDEWAPNARWSLHGGLRVEGIATRGEGAQGEVQKNTSQVTTPLLHAVWKPNPTRRDQVRASLTRSYRAPNLDQLIGRPTLNRVRPPPGSNDALTADTAGNPALKPEVALGLDLAFERYLADGGVLSVNLFHRRIHDLIRSVVTLEDVSWSPGQPRYVSRPQNIGSATTAGVELEAKTRLDQWVGDAPAVELRANTSLFYSRVDDVPGPDNRVAEQPGGTLNLGADYRWRGTPLTLGGNLNHTPGYTTRLAVDRWSIQSSKTVLDAYALWTFTPEMKLRLSVSNALAKDSLSTTQTAYSGVLESNTTNTRTYATAQLRLELKL